MVKESYQFGENVIDPCCGTGNFIIGVIQEILKSDKEKKIKYDALENIYGLDINPISVFIAKINTLYLLREYEDIKLNIFQTDSLFELKNINFPGFDLVIGNPPWYTYRDIESPEYQQKIKKLAEKLEIKPRPKNILNIEISTLFFYFAKGCFLRENGKIFFVITEGVLNGSHAARFRTFKGFKDIKIWTFSKNLERAFNVKFICLFAKKDQKREKIPNFQREIPTVNYELRDTPQNNKRINREDLISKEGSFLTPYGIERKGKKVYVKKFISKKKYEEILPNKESKYKTLFHKGADLNPRNLIFVKSQSVVEGSLVRINPDPRVFKRAKRPWTKKEYRNEFVEKKYIFNVIKSTELVKFFVYDSYKVFLPLNPKDLSYDYESLEENARKFYNKINQIYLKYKKKTTKHTSLLDNLNRWSKLINERQLSNLKVVYNNSGSILNAAVIQGDYLITGDLSFYSPKSIEEGYYLSAVLNSSVLTKQVNIRKSSRHIFKLPFSIPIKIFDNKNPNHLRISELGRRAEKKVKKSIKLLSQEKSKFPSKFKLQKGLSKKLGNLLSEINELVTEEF